MPIEQSRYEALRNFPGMDNKKRVTDSDLAALVRISNELKDDLIAQGRASEAVYTGEKIPTPNVGVIGEGYSSSPQFNKKLA